MQGVSEEDFEGDLEGELFNSLELNTVVDRFVSIFCLDYSLLYVISEPDADQRQVCH